MTRARRLPGGTLAVLLGGAVAPGLYRWRPAVRSATEVSDALAAAVEAGWRGAVLDLAEVHDKEAFLDRCAMDLELPGWFGRNWDALHDCLTDLSWWGESRGLLILVSGWQEFQRAAPGPADMAEQIFEDAVTWRRGQAAPLSVLVD